MTHYKNLDILEVFNITGRGLIFKINIKDNQLVDDEWADDIFFRIDDLITYENKIYIVTGIETQQNLLNSKKSVNIGLNVKLFPFVHLELAKRLKLEGYSKPTLFYYQDKDLPYSKSGLKRVKNNDELNHNKYDEFIYSAPIMQDGIDWLIGKNIKYGASIIIKFGKK